MVERDVANVEVARSIRVNRSKHHRPHPRPARRSRAGRRGERLFSGPATGRRPPFPGRLFGKTPHSGCGELGSNPGLGAQALVVQLAGDAAMRRPTVQVRVLSRAPGRCSSRWRSTAFVMRRTRVRFLSPALSMSSSRWSNGLGSPSLALLADVAQRQSVRLITGRHPARHRASALSTTCPGSPTAGGTWFRTRTVRVRVALRVRSNTMGS